MEKYNDWIIDEKDITKWYLRGGQIKLLAKIYPNIENLHDFLRDNDIYTANLDIDRFTGIGHWDLSPHLGYFEDLHLSGYERAELTERNRRIVSALQHFCNITVYETTQKGHSYVDTNSMSNTHNRAMNKIKEWIRQNLPNPRVKLIAYLKKEGLISSNVNPFCEILSKDI